MTEAGVGQARGGCARPYTRGSRHFRLTPRWTGVRVVEGTGLENRQTRKGFEGSNPSLSVLRPEEVRGDSGR